MKEPVIDHPAAWLAGLATRLREEFAEPVPVEGVAGGALWLSLRVGGRFLWLLCSNELRAAWWTPSPAPRDWLQILQRHRNSPFARELRGRSLVDAVALQTADSKLDGLRLRFADGGALSLRFYPRPGGFWLQTSGGDITAQQGRMDGPDLVETRPDSAFDADAHAAHCEAALRQLLDHRLSRWLGAELRREEKKRTRRLLAQETDLARAEARLSLRAKADLLAAHLHEIRPGESAVVLEDFEGERQSIELDPKLAPAANLEALYRKAAKAERTVATLRERLRELKAPGAGGAPALERLTHLQTLEDRIAFAHELGLPLAPPDKGAGKRAQTPSERLPYHSYRLPGGEELRVGRSAKDNDALLRQHSSGRDLWLHAQGVEGSHVILRATEREPSAAVVEAAARVAAEFSKARNSALVPVLVTQRKYVRKPRKAAPGAVVAERGKTVFVEPGIPEGCTRPEDD